MRGGGCMERADYYFANGQLYTLWITRKDVQLFAAPWSPWDQHMLQDCASTHKDMREVVYSGTLHGMRVNSQSSRALELLTLKLISAELLEQRQEETLLIAPHGLLHQLPIHALRHQGVPLLEHFTLHYTPNLQAFTQLAGRHEKQKHTPWLLYGVSDFGRRARALEHARHEVKVLATLMPPGGRVCCDETATRAQLLEWNASARVTTI